VKYLHFVDWKFKGTGFPNLSNSRYAKSRNAEMRNCETPFGAACGHHWWSREGKELVQLSSFFRVSGIATWSVKISHHKECRNVEIPKCEMAKSTRDPVLVIQRCWILGNLIEGLLFLFTINCSVTIQLSEPNHGSWTVGVSVAEALF
jgi:hypothetical protein